MLPATSVSTWFVALPTSMVTVTSLPTIIGTSGMLTDPMVGGVWSLGSDCATVSGKAAAASDAAFQASSRAKPPAMINLSGVVPPKPVAPSSAMALVSLRTSVRWVLSVTTAETMSPVAKPTGLEASPLMSQLSLLRSSRSVMSVLPKLSPTPSKVS